MDDFPIQFRFIEGIAVVTVEGPGNAELVDLVGAAIEELIARERYRIIVYIRNSGVGVFRDSVQSLVMAYSEEVRENGGDIRLVVDGSLDGFLGAGAN